MDSFLDVVILSVIAIVALRLLVRILKKNGGKRKKSKKKRKLQKILFYVLLSL